MSERGPAPEFVIVGHVVQDLLPDGGWRPGGAACYAALLARNLGFRTAVLTACADDFPLEKVLPGVEVRRAPSEATTQMRNVYDGHRTQWLPKRASTLTAEHLPESWRRADIVLLGPVAGEIHESLAGAFGPDSLVGVGVQGWLRAVDAESRVRPLGPKEWDAAPFVSHADAVFASDEDLTIDSAPAALAEWSTMTGVVAFTRGAGGADVFADGEWTRVDAFPANPVDLTGAGDVFAAAFLAGYARQRNPTSAARFASAAASLVIEGIGIEGVPVAAQIEARLSARG